MSPDSEVEVGANGSGCVVWRRTGSRERKVAGWQVGRWLAGGGRRPIGLRNLGRRKGELGNTG